MRKFKLRRLSNISILKVDPQTKCADVYRRTQLVNYAIHHHTVYVKNLLHLSQIGTFKIIMG